MTKKVKPEAPTPRPGEPFQSEPPKPLTPVYKLRVAEELAYSDKRGGTQAARVRHFKALQALAAAE